MRKIFATCALIAAVLLYPVHANAQVGTFTGVYGCHSDPAPTTGVPINAHCLGYGIAYRQSTPLFDRYVLVVFFAGTWAFACNTGSTTHHSHVLSLNSTTVELAESIFSGNGSRYVEFVVANMNPYLSKSTTVVSAFQKSKCNP
jgi:hypothetical protein